MVTQFQVMTGQVMLCLDINLSLHACISPTSGPVVVCSVPLVATPLKIASIYIPN